MKLSKNLCSHDEAGALEVVAVASTRSTGGEERVVEGRLLEDAVHISAEFLASLEPALDGRSGHQHNWNIVRGQLVVVAVQFRTFRGAGGVRRIRQIRTNRLVAQNVEAEQLAAGTRPSGAKLVAAAVAEGDQLPAA